MKPLPERAALVTGASSGIGAAIARSLASAGVSVAVTARRQERLDDLVAEIEAAGGRAIAIAGDISDEGFARSAVQQTVEQLGAVDILVNAAGTIQKGGFADCDTQEWRDTFALNLFAPLYTAVEALPHMAEAGGGDIIQISSTSARRPAAVFASYGASKHALNGMSWSLREEAGKLGVRVCVVEPGATRSEIAQQIRDPAMSQVMQSHVCGDDAMEAEDIAAMVLAIVSLPPRANVQELLIRPTADVSSF